MNMMVENVKSNIPKLDIYARRTSGRRDKGKIASLHYHDELEFLMVHSGRFLCRVDGKDYIATDSDVIFINAGVPHETENLEDGTRVSLIQFRESRYLNTEIRKIIKYSVKFQNWEGEPVRIIRSRELFETLEALLLECEEKKNAYEIMARSLVLKIIGTLYRERILSDGEQVFASSAVQKILPALSTINEKYAENISLDDISALLGFDRSYFCRIFKSATGATFTEYLNFVRICKAEKLLSTTDSSILDISADVGFSSVSYFNKIFKKYKNCSPSFYRSAKYCKNM